MDKSPAKVTFFSVDELIPLNFSEELRREGVPKSSLDNLDLKVSKGYFTTKKAANKKLKEAKKDNPGMKLAITTLVCEE